MNDLLGVRELGRDSLVIIKLLLVYFLNLWRMFRTERNGNKRGFISGHQVLLTSQGIMNLISIPLSYILFLYDYVLSLSTNLNNVRV